MFFYQYYILLSFHFNFGNKYLKVPLMFYYQITKVKQFTEYPKLLLW